MKQKKGKMTPKDSLKKSDDVKKPKYIHPYRLGKRIWATYIDEWNQFQSNADCGRNNRNLCSIAIDEDRRASVCFECWYQYFAQEDKRPSAHVADYNSWRRGDDDE